jgi:gamma-glutamylcyclotransferase (GGCT)/AIG2-like uncharacterized protein YtfP
MCEGKLIPIFIYGTLIKDMHQYHQGFTEPIPDEIENVDMYNLGVFPAVKKGTGTAKGYIICVNTEVLSLLDHYECSPYLYKRVQTITKGGRPVQYYHFNKDVRDAPLVVDGVWKCISN